MLDAVISIGVIVIRCQRASAVGQSITGQHHIRALKAMCVVPGIADHRAVYMCVMPANGDVFASKINL